MAYFTDAQKKQQQLNKWGTGPTRMVRPKLPNNYDATEGRNRWGAPNASVDKYLDNNRKMYEMEDVPPMARPVNNGWMAPGISGAMDVARRYGSGPDTGDMGDLAVQQTATQLARNPSVNAAARWGVAAKPSAPRPSTEADAFVDNQPGSVRPDSWRSGALAPVMQWAKEGAAQAASAEDDYHSTAAQSDRYYGRRAAKLAKQPFARRITAMASPSPQNAGRNSLRFNNSPSGWTPLY